MSDMDRQAALDLLGVQEGADLKAIRAAWRELVRSYHPDQAKQDPKAANARLAEINAAYDVVIGTEPDTAHEVQSTAAQEKHFADLARRNVVKERIFEGWEETSDVVVGRELTEDERAALDAAEAGFAEARAIFENHPRAQIRAMFH